MIAPTHRTFLRNLKIFDIAIMVICFFLAAYVVSFGIGTVTFGQFLSMRIKVQNFIIFLCLLLAWHVVLSSFGLYRLRHMTRLRDAMGSIVKATSLGTLLVALAGILLRIKLVTPFFILTFWVSCTILTIVCRGILRRIVQWMGMHATGICYQLIIGTGKEAHEYAQKIANTAGAGYRIIGYVSEAHETGMPPTIEGIHVVTGLNELPSFLRHTVVDEVVICLPAGRSYEDILAVISLCERHGITVRIVADPLSRRLAKGSADELYGTETIILDKKGIEGWDAFIKRVLDIVIASLLLIVAFPIMVVTAVAIKLTSQGPVFFIQERVGLNKRVFSMYKFRTMTPDAEKRLSDVAELNEADGPAFKIRHDPRATPLGGILREFAIDELPQLMNVLKGDMSMVGPRPLPMRDYEGFDKDWQRRRFSVRPGITGLWQVSGRHALSFDAWMKLDIEYIDRWSLLLDMEILAKTIPAVLRRTKEV
ncbi:MAG: sugar transferase [Syntrophorhabdaceae bacterium]|nr:sugar transferase [Syntrophorhabdaceae bacterium]